MICAPVSRTASGVIAFTVAAVPTGMKVGVSMGPWAVCSRPWRAAPSRALTSKRTVMLPAGLAERRACIAIGGETQDGIPGVAVERPSAFEADKGRDQNDRTQVGGGQRGDVRGGSRGGRTIKH